MIGGSGEKVTLRLVAQYAQWCNVGGDPAPGAAPATGDLSACEGKVQDEGRACYLGEIKVIVGRAGDKPLPAVQQVSD